MDNYIGCKIIQAEPMSLGEFKVRFSKVYPAGGGEEDGYHVRYPDGYHSWSPKTGFEQAYRRFSEDEYKLLAIQPVIGEYDGENAEMLRKALAGLVGTVDKAELLQIEAITRQADLPDIDKTATINAVQALIKTS